IGDWMYRVMAGLQIDESMPGYKHIVFHPQPGGGFTSVKASHETMYGPASSAWTLKDGRFELAVAVPPNTRATVRLPKAQLASVSEGEGGQALAKGNGITDSRQDGDSVVVEVGSGQYRFAYAPGK